MNAPFAFSHIDGIMGAMSRRYQAQDRYCLTPGDLAAPGVTVTIRNISYQGLEQLNPVLHLTEYPNRPLVLNTQQCADLIRVTQSSVAQDWIGQKIVLSVKNQTTPPLFAISAPTQSRAPVGRALPRLVVHGKFWSTLLLLLVLAAAFGAVYLLERLDQIR